MAGHEDAGVVTCHIGTNTPKLVPPSLGTTALRTYSNGAVQIRVCLERADKSPPNLHVAEGLGELCSGQFLNAKPCRADAAPEHLMWSSTRDCSHGGERESSHRNCFLMQVWIGTFPWERSQLGTYIRVL